MTNDEALKRIKKELYLVHEIESCEIERFEETKVRKCPGCNPGLVITATGWEKLSIRIRFKRGE